MKTYCRGAGESRTLIYDSSVPGNKRYGKFECSNSSGIEPESRLRMCACNTCYL